MTTKIGKNYQVRKIRLVTWVGFFINIILSALKISAGIFGKSQAVVADGIHSLSDTATDIAIIFGSYFWSKPPDESHPYGHKRIETIVSIFIGFILIFAGVTISIDAIYSIKTTENISPGWISLAVTAISIISKEILYQWTIITGKKIKSLSLTANAWHHRTDAISSIPVFIAVGISIYRPDLNYVDNIGAVFVSLLVIFAALKIIFSGFKELIDFGAPKELLQKIIKIAHENNQVREVHSVRTRYAGNCLQVDLHVLVDAFITVKKGHDIAEDVKRKIIKKGPDVIDVIVHIEPYE